MGRGGIGRYPSGTLVGNAHPSSSMNTSGFQWFTNGIGSGLALKACPCLPLVRPLLQFHPPPYPQRAKASVYQQDALHCICPPFSPQRVSIAVQC
jgi:hypothetical protein